MNYENRVTVFIDILGFKDLLGKTYDRKGLDNEEGIELIIDAYKSIRDVWDLDNKENSQFDRLDKGSKRITTFSDCLVISFLAKEPSKIFSTLIEIKHMIIRLIYRGILCRGAITYGKLIHTEQMLFGPALVEAYILESKAALYPRIILDREIIDLAGQAKNLVNSKHEEIEYVESLLEMDSDGMYYIDYFDKAREELDDPEYDFPNYLKILGDKIRKGLMGSSNPMKADIRVKYNWMKEKYNAIIDKVNDSYMKHLSKMYGDPELLNAITEAQLEKINPRRKY